MRWKDKNDETFLSKTQQVDTTSQSKETFIMDEKIHSDNINIKQNDYISSNTCCKNMFFSNLSIFHGYIFQY